MCYTLEYLKDKNLEVAISTYLLRGMTSFSFANCTKQLGVALFFYVAGVHFVLRRKDAGNFELVWLISKSHAPAMSFPGGGTNFPQLSTAFVVYSVRNSSGNARKNGQYFIKT